MNKHEIKKILNNKYNRDEWKILVKNIFNDTEYFKEPLSIKTENDKILDFIQIGNLKLSDNKKIALFELRLIKNLNIYKNKVELRNIVTKFIDQYSNHGVLVIFDNQGQDYRLTFSTKYSEIDQDGSIKNVETSSKKYTYLLGETESCITPAERLHKLSLNNKKIKIDNIIEAFSVDKLTDQFFTDYKNLFLKISDSLTQIRKKDKKIDKNFIKNNIHNNEFAKRLLGQIVFIYFIQKKGWLGIKQNADGSFNKWGSGPKNFFKKLFNKDYCDYKNFFNDVLEPFFISLSEDLTENYSAKLKCKIPHLNGGLFEPLKNYDWLQTEILIENDIIKEIINVFDQYNFTIFEEDKEESEVAIDPEMLGKVLENLISIKDRKSKGIFYTPRQVVKYMVENSVFLYLKNSFKDENITQDLSIFFKNEKLAESNKFLKKNFKRIDDLLKNILICDPAVGSGAYPVELMNFIVSLRRRLNVFFEDKKRSNYRLKLNFIKNSLFGNDIDESAIETSKLRLWLSLVIDEDDYERIRSLPNLDFKITFGDSLTVVEKNLFNNDKLKELDILKNEYFTQNNLRKKKQIKQEILSGFADLFGKDNFFDIEIIYNEVFEKKGGFDIIVSNPPYYQIQKIKDKLYKKKLKDNFEVFDSFGDLYCLFIERSLKLLNENGVVSLITSNKWLKTSYGDKLRNYFLSKKNLLQLIDFKKTPIFESADVDTSIVLCTNQKKNTDDIKCTVFNTIIKHNDLEKFINLNSIDIKFSLNDPWTIANKETLNLLDKLTNIQNKLNLKKLIIKRGLLTGLNKAFIVSEKQRKLILTKSQAEKKIFSKILRGSCMNFFSFSWDNYYLINSHNGYDDIKKVNLEKDFPNTFKHIKEFKKDLMKRLDKGDHWTNLRNCAYMNAFKKPKIAWMNMNRKWKFSYVPGDYLLEASLNFIADDTLCKFLTCILSSKLHEWFFIQKGRIFDDGGYMTKIDTIIKFPILNPNQNDIKHFNKLFDKLIKINNVDKKNKSLLDNEVYKFYKLNQNDIKIIEESV
jgi:hypothetical protein